jgi:glyoxylase-like metal-dependent hydrolase (beta-lactamase superfamily II)
VEAGLAAHGLALADLRHLVLTHIHMDHAGASGAIVARNPAVRVYVHTRGAPHLIDPSRLVNSATMLWGERTHELWGHILPVPPEVIQSFTGGETLRLGDVTLRAYDAPGHARHHLVWQDEGSGSVFVGDNLGVRLPNVGFTRPATPPPEVDLPAWKATLELIEGLAPSSVRLTHFGSFADVAFHLADFRERLFRWGELVRVGLLSGKSEQEQIDALNAVGQAEAASLTPPEQAALAQQSGDLALSWRGIARYWQKAGIITGER